MAKEISPEKRFEDKQLKELGIKIDFRLLDPALIKTTRRGLLKIIGAGALALFFSRKDEPTELTKPEESTKNIIETTQYSRITPLEQKPIFEPTLTPESTPETIPTPEPTPSPEPTPTPTPTPEPTPTPASEQISVSKPPMPEIKKLKTQIIYRGRPGTKKVAFTIDDTSNFDLLKYLLDLATNKNIKMVWFLIGRTVDPDEADLIKEALNTGLIRIGNHSLSHNIARFSNLELGYLREEIEGWIAKMRSFDIDEEELLRYFRPPGGAGGYNGGDADLLELLSEIGYQYLCMWDVEFIYNIRTRYGGNYTLENVLDILQKNIYGTEGGNLVLFHFNPVDLSALKIITDKLLKDNYQFVFPEELIV
jgi:peptidoglycan/xylan/chitin deacetylase (PgdA/CDA1 family)